MNSLVSLQNEYRSQQNPTSKSEHAKFEADRHQFEVPQTKFPLCRYTKHKNLNSWYKDLKRMKDFGFKNLAKHLRKSCGQKNPFPTTAQGREWNR